MLIYVNITDRRTERQTDKHIKSIVRNLTKLELLYLVKFLFALIKAWKLIAQRSMDTQKRMEWSKTSNWKTRTKSKLVPLMSCSNQLKYLKPRALLESTRSRRSRQLNDAGVPSETDKCSGC